MTILMSRDCLLFVLTMSIAMFSRNHAFRRHLTRSTQLSSGTKTVLRAASSDPTIIEKFQSHQAAARRLSLAEEIRTLVQQSTGYGVLSTNSMTNAGYPVGSVVGFQVRLNNSCAIIGLSIMLYLSRLILKASPSLCSARCPDTLKISSRMEEPRCVSHRRTLKTVTKDAYTINSEKTSLYLTPVIRQLPMVA